MLGLIRNIVKYRLGILNEPYLITFLPTLRCNARCTGCDIWKLEKESCKELTLSEIKSIFRQFRHLEIVKITGGEPFLRTDLPEILSFLTDTLRVTVQITSNGLLNKRIIETVRKFSSEKFHLCISLDGIGDFVDQKRGIPNYFEQVMGTLRELAHIKRQSRFYLSVNQTVFFDHLDQINLLREALSRVGINNVQYSIEHNLFDFNATEKEKLNYWKCISKQSFLKLKDIVGTPSMSEINRHLIYRYYFKGLENRVLKNQKSPQFKCSALNSYFRLFPNGDLVTCSVYTTPIVNLKNSDFRTLWQGKRIQRQRTLVQNCPGCWFGCEVVPNAVINGDIWKAFFL